MPGCAMGNCRNYSSKSKGQGIIYHSFPHDPKRAKLWVLKCRRKDKINVKTASVCSAHFSADDYMRDLKAELLGCKPRRVLKPTAVPKPELTSKFLAPRCRKEKSKLPHKNSCTVLIKPKVKAEECSNDSTNIKPESSIKEVPDTSPMCLSSSVAINPLVIKLGNDTMCNLPLKKMLKSRVEAALTPNSNNATFDINSNETNPSLSSSVNNSVVKAFSNNQNINCLANNDYTQSTPLVIKEETTGGSVHSNSTDIIFECSSVDIIDEAPEKYLLSLTPSLPIQENGRSSTEQSAEVKNFDACDNIRLFQDQVQTRSSSSNHQTYEQGEEDESCINVEFNKKWKRKIPLAADDSNGNLDKVSNSGVVDSNCTCLPLKHDVTTAIGLLMSQPVDLNEPMTESNGIEIDESEDGIPEKLYAKDYKRPEKKYHHKSIQTVRDTYDPRFLINRIKWLEHKVQTLKNAVIKRDTRIKSLRSIVAASKQTVHNKVYEILGKLFTPNQIQCLETGKKCRNWNTETLNQAATLYTISKKAYVFLRKTMGFPFPGLTSIKRWLRIQKRMEKEQKISQAVINEPATKPPSSTKVETLVTDSELRELTIKISTARG